MKFKMRVCETEGWEAGLESRRFFRGSECQVKLDGLYSSSIKSKDDCSLIPYSLRDNYLSENVEC